jgi:carboxypeptidase Taq
MQVLDEVKQGLVPLIKAVTSKPQLKTKYVLAGKFDVARQEQLSRAVAGALGFDWNAGRFDESVHPFTGGPHPTDVRITTRFNPTDLLSALMGACPGRTHQGEGWRAGNTGVAAKPAPGLRRCKSCEA